MMRLLPPFAVDSVPGPEMADWCQALRDDNPIHLDRAAAERLGFGPYRVNPGPANLAYLLNMVMIDDPDAEIARVEASFLANLLEGDRAVAVGELAAPDRVTASLHRPRDGEPVVTAVIELRRPAP
ncbi:acyl dehydratase [Sphingomonas jejuensis]|uniref:Acyl dehydratase n=1 Tax=Sphingomonas jejuensis TaxID=904715 RepID=A0ABX0XHS6_9SPHN|nr:hypothetical protein [Sphingomonas jejuensis]NJC32892.1 acyl dehydratase [Sphingomonas jejuensis]